MPRSDNELKTDYQEIYDYSREGWSSSIDESMIDHDFYNLAQISSEEAEQADIQNRLLYTNDKIRRQVDLLAGYEIKNRHTLKIVPQGSADPAEDMACQQHTGVIQHLMGRFQGYHLLSESFKWGSLVSGSNLMEIWRDRNGDIQFNRLGYNHFLLHPSLRKSDLSDCQDVMTGQWITQQQAQMLVPSAADEIEDIPASTTSQRWDRLGHPGSQNRMNMRMYEQWWRREFELVPTVMSRNTGQEIPFKVFADSQFNGDTQTANRIIKEMLGPNGQPVFEKFKKSVPKIMLTVFMDNVPIFDGVNPLKIRDHNYIWMRGDWCPEATRNGLKLQSFVRALRDPQRGRNRRLNQLMDIIETQITTLRVARTKWLENPEAAYQSGQGVVAHTSNEMPDDAPLTNAIAQLPGPGVPPGLFQLIELLDKDGIEASGLNEEIFGSDDKDIPALLSKHRTGQALTGLAGIFENFREAKRALGVRLIKAIQANYSQNKVQEIINQQVVPDFYDPNLSRFDCIPTEGLLTESQQATFYQELLTLRQLGDDFAAVITPSVIARYAPVMFPQELIKAIQAKEQQTAQAGQSQAKSQEVINQLIQGQTKLDMAKTLGEIADADQSRASARLDNAKTLTELQSLETNQISELTKRMTDIEKVAVAREKVQNDAVQQKSQKERQT